METTAIKDLLEKPIYSMSGNEFLSLLKHGVNMQEERSGKDKTRLIKGRGALAAELGVSVMTLIDWEKQGFFKPETKIGRILIYDLDQVIEDLKKAGKTVIS